MRRASFAVLHFYYSIRLWAPPQNLSEKSKQTLATFNFSFLKLCPCLLLLSQILCRHLFQNWTQPVPTGLFSYSVFRMLSMLRDSGATSMGLRRRLCYRLHLASVN